MQAFWLKLREISQELTQNPTLADDLQSQFAHWQLKTMPTPIKSNDNLLGFAYYSPTGFIRITNYNLGMRGKLKKTKYLVDVANQNRYFHPDLATVLEADSEILVLKEARKLESVFEQKVEK